MQVAVISNHQNGRDTHLRQLRVLGPRPDPNRPVGHELSLTTPEFQQFATVR